MRIVKNNFVRLLLVCFLSAALVSAGFFAPGIEYAWAVLPLIFALRCESRLFRTAWIFPYFMAIGIISGWGLVSMEYPVAPVIILAVVLSGALTSLLVLAGTSIGLVALALVPFVPGHPFLALGTIAPNGGFAAIVLAFVVVFVLEKLPKASKSVETMAMVICLGFLWNLGAGVNYARGGSIVKSEAEVGVSAPSWVEAPVPYIHEASDRLRSQMLRSVMEPNGVYITGENIILSSDDLSLQSWCHFAQSKNVTVFLGVQLVETGRASVVKLQPASKCSASNLVYASWIGIPEITGAWAPFAPLVVDPQDQVQQTSWLACFEGFSFAAWLKTALNEPQSVIIVSNDYWTEPLPISNLRRKVSRNFERLFGLDVYHADAARNLLKLEKNS